MEDITLLRAELDVINEQLIDVLVRRFEVTDRIGKYKVEKELPLKDEQREREMYEEIRNVARKQKLDEDYAVKILRAIVECVYEQHKKNGLKI